MKKECKEKKKEYQKPKLVKHEKLSILTGRSID